MSPSRRAFVLALPVLGAGCTGIDLASTPTPTPRPDGDGDGVPDGGDDYPDDDRRAFRSFSIGGTYTLTPGEFSAVALTNSPRASGDYLHYEAAVAGDTPVDCLVFRRDAYDAYENGRRDVSVVSAYSRTGVTETSVTEQLGRGEFIFALDHTAQATDPGSAPVDVDFTLELADPARPAGT